MFYSTARNQLHSGKFLSEPEADHLESVLLRKLDSGEERNALMLLIAMRTGARAGELLAIKKSDFQYNARHVFIRGSKGSNDREVPMPDWLCKKIQAYVHRLPTERLFDISYERLTQIWYDFRPVKKRFHSLRHTFALRAYIQTKDIRLVQMALGHRSILNTLIYIDYVHRTSELKKIVYN